LIADRVAVEVQGRVYGAHFAWSHLWWVFSYPLAGWMGNYLPNYTFLASSLIGATIFGLVCLLFHSKQDVNSGLWHEHEHTHDNDHQHRHSSDLNITLSHHHLHFH
jgi:NRE family putative nickel resistance protein-like MFS transporter